MLQRVENTTNECLSAKGKVFAFVSSQQRETMRRPVCFTGVEIKEVYTSSKKFN